MLDSLNITGVFDGYRILLAPMAGVSDIAFRSLCREFGADMAFTEMVSAKGLSYANEKTRHLLDLAPDEKRVAVQLFGHDPVNMAQQATWVEDQMGSGLAFIDINMGCPARKIVKKGDGSALMNDPELAAAIVKQVSSSVACPVTVKFRRGWKAGEETASEFAKRLEQAGASACTVHGRFADQLYRGNADWNVIARVKSSISIPVIGNGDITCGADAVKMVTQTNCDAVMIARAAEGNPWVFADVKAAFGLLDSYEPPTIKDRIQTARRHATLLSQREGRNIARMRKHAAWYVSGIPGAAKARQMFNKCTSIDDFYAVFDMLIDSLRCREESENAS